MKKQIFSLGLMLAAAFTLTNCAKEEVNFQQPEAEGTPFEIVASTVATKTTNNELATEWAAGDAINLFHAATDKTTYISDGSFSIAEADLEAGKFKGTLNGTLAADEKYDWYAFYPYSGYIKTPANTSTGYMPVGCKANEAQAQNGYDSMAHIAGANYPLAGKAYACPANTLPVLEMAHVTSLVEVVVTNTTDKPLTVSEVIFNAPEDLVGTFYINFADVITSASFKSSGDGYTSKTAKLSVANGTALQKGQTAKFYIAVKPFTAAASKTLSILVNGYKKQITLANETEFAAGKIKTLNFAYDNTAEAKALALPWVEDFTSKDLSNYVITSTESETKLYTENSAGGASPELLIAKSGGSLTALLATGGYVGDLTLTFVSNHPDYVSVTATAGVTVAKVSDVEYTLTVPEGVAEFSVCLKNSKTSNTRVDNIEVARPRAAQTLSFATAEYEFALNSAELAAFEGQVVSGNKTSVVYSSDKEDVATVDPETGKVTVKNVVGAAIITATAQKTDEYKGATATYKVVVVDPTAEEPVYETKELSFSSTSARTSFSTTAQVWEQNGIKFTNKKASSSNNVADYSNPIRLYAGSSIDIEKAKISKIVFTANTTSYASTLKTSIGTVSGATVTASSSTVTVEFANNVDSFTIAKLTAQVRLNKIAVTYQTN